MCPSCHQCIPLTHRPARPPPASHPPCWRQAGADPWKVLRQVREKLRLNAAAVQLPIGSEDQQRGLVDLIDRRAFHFEGASGEEVVGECTPACVPACLPAAFWDKRWPTIASALQAPP